MKLELVSRRPISQDFKLFRTRQEINAVCVDTGGRNKYDKFANGVENFPFNVTTTIEMK